MTGSGIACAAGTAAIRAVASAAANERLSAAAGSAGVVLIAADAGSTRPASTGVDRGMSALTDHVAIEGRGAAVVASAETNFGEVKNMTDLQALMETAALLYFPEEHKYEFKIVDNNTFVGHVLECYVHRMVSKAGTTAIHRCAAKLRFDSWRQAMGLDGEVANEKDTSNCNGTCEILFKIRW